MCMKTNMLTKFLALTLLHNVFSLDVGSEEHLKEASPTNKRAGRLFFVSTTTSTLSTTTVCAVTDSSLTTCVGRKKRAIVANPENEEGNVLDIAPKRVAREVNAEDADDVDVDELKSTQKE